MSPERAAAVVLRWARAYTRELPSEVAARRTAELESDLHEHIAHERERGTGEGRIARDVLSRMVRGAPADAAWRLRFAATPAARRNARVPGRAPRSAGRAAFGILRAVALVLLLPLIATLTTDAVDWGPFDFVAAGVLVGGTGLVRELLVRGGTLAYRAGVGVGLGTVLLLVWVSLAVGLVGRDGDPADLVYVGVLAVGVVGAVLARLRPAGMARALAATAAAHGVAATVAVLAGKHQAESSSVGEIVLLNAFFAGLFLASAALFALDAWGRSRVDRDTT